MKALLFDTQGSISRAEYFTGCIVLLIAQYCLHMGGLALMVLSLLPQAVSSLILSFAMMLLAYPYFCLYGKRLESLSYSRWWFAPILVVFYASLMVFGYLSGEVSGLYLSETITSYTQDDLTRLFLFQIPSVITLYLGTVVLDLCIGFLKPARQTDEFTEYA